MDFNPVLFLGAVFLFALVAIGMLLAPLLIGKLIRPKLPNPIKDDIYECGEPTIGTSTIQFDLRFYVIALLFIVFEVEVAFFFPWAVVFGKANTLANTRLTEQQRAHVSAALVTGDPTTPFTKDGKKVETIQPETARQFMMVALCDLLVFFAVVLVGFFYVWRRGDLDWVRSVARQEEAASIMEARPPPTVSQKQPVAAG